MHKAYHKFEEIPFDEAIELVELPDGIQVSQEDNWCGLVDEDGCGYTESAKCLKCGQVIFSDQGGDYTFGAGGDGSCEFEIPQYALNGMLWHVFPNEGGYGTDRYASSNFVVGGRHIRRFQLDELPEYILAEVKVIEAALGEREHSSGW